MPRMKSFSACVLIGLLFFSSTLHGQQPKPQSEEADSQRTTRPRVATDFNVEVERHEFLEQIRTEPVVLNAARRWICAIGRAPEQVREARSKGLNYIPDASKSCVITLERQAREGKSMELYEKLAEDDGGTLRPEEVLDAVRTAAMNNQLDVVIGSKGGIAPTPFLSLDAGYTKGARDKATMSSLGIAVTPENVGKLMGIAEACLDGQNKSAPSPSTCYATGLTLAAKDNSIASAEEEAREHEFLQVIWTEPASLNDSRRWLCARGGEPELIRKFRSEGFYDSPDASKSCITTLERQADEGKQMALYKKFAEDAGGTMTQEQVFNAVETAAKNNQPTTVAIGPKGAIATTPSLSLDAGYSKGARDKVTMSSLGITITPENVGKLMGIAEACLDGQNKSAPSQSTCYATGLTLAAKDNSSKGAK